jgi:hypothetical protein
MAKPRAILRGREKTQCWVRQLMVGIMAALRNSRERRGEDSNA